MTHQLNVTHSRSDALNYLTITHDRTFNGKPLYYFEDGLVLEYLEKIDRVLNEALNQYPRIYAVHINLNLPSDFEGYYLAVFAHFFRILESETNELCKDKNTQVELIDTSKRSFAISGLRRMNPPASTIILSCSLIGISFKT